MSDEKGKVSDKASEIAKNIWLAGVGAYGRAVDEAQGRLEKAGVEPPKLFKDLVKAGAALEEEARGASQSVLVASCATTAPRTHAFPASIDGIMRSRILRSHLVRVRAKVRVGGKGEGPA